MESSGQELLRLILNNRQDDMPRLVYADWLEEQFRFNNDPALEARAEFIRLQIALNAGTPLPEQRQAFRREQHLKQTYGPYWAGELLGIAADWNFRRGFVHHLQMDARQFLESHDFLAATHPIEHLHLTWGMETPRERAEDLGRISSQSLIPYLTSLDLTGAGVGSDGVTQLAHHAPLENLQELTMPGNRIGARGLRAILQSPWMPGLRKLDLADNEINHQGVRLLLDFLAAAKETGELLAVERIDLRGNPLSVAGGRLLRSPPLSRLVRW